jgi:hypothetical protein
VLIGALLGGGEAFQVKCLTKFKIFWVFDCQQICQQRSFKGVVPE